MILKTLIFSFSFLCLSVAEQVVLDTGTDDSSILASAHKRAITPDVAALVEELMRKGGIPGLSLGIVHSNHTTEVEAWGIKTEDGDELATDVGSQLLPVLCHMCTGIHALTLSQIDLVQYRILLQSVSLGFFRYTHRRLCSWQKYYRTAYWCTAL